MVKFLNNQPDFYYWFYSTLSQSLAALIGLSGVFVVYRLQLQEKYISDAVKTLQRYLSKIIIGSDFSYMTRDAVINSADGEIRYHEQQIEQHNRGLENIKQQLKNGEGSAGNLSDQQSSILIHVKTDEEIISLIKIKRAAIIGEEWYKRQIQMSALIAISYFIILFMFSMLGIIHKFTNIYTLTVFIELLFGLILLFLCCAVSLDFGRPALKDSFKILVNSIRVFLLKKIC